MKLFGYIEETDSDGDEIETTWGIPAQNERFARRQAKINTRIKYGSGSEIVSVEEDGEGDLPGQSVYRIVTVSER